MEEWKRQIEETGVHILRVLQYPVCNGNAQTYVFLVLDTDGRVKVWKQKNVHEQRVMERLKDVLGIPAYRSERRIDGVGEFLVFDVCYGQTLAYMRSHRLFTDAEAERIVHDVARILYEMHKRGVWHLDIRPENILWDGRQVWLIDMGDACIVSEGTGRQKAQDPLYIPPEIHLFGKATPTSEVFQLGMLYVRLTQEKHPFKKEESENTSLIQQTIAYGEAHVKQERTDVILEPLLWQMLAKDPTHRPVLEAVIELTNQGVAEQIQNVYVKQDEIEKRPVVLFPARMGVPHKGHIEFIKRLLFCGFHVRISLQRTFTRTQRDPLPKWIVQKMVEQALLLAGCDVTQVSWIFTPFYRTQIEHALHFAMMPNKDEIRAVASGNAEVHNMHLYEYHFDQNSVFGKEGVEFVTRSWGEMVRKALREGDLQEAKKWLAEGVTSVLSLEEIRTYCLMSQERIYVTGKVRVHLVDEKAQLIEAICRRYLSPEESLIHALREQNIPVEIKNIPQTTQTRWKIRGVEGVVQFQQETEKDGDLLITYQFKTEVGTH